MTIKAKIVGSSFTSISQGTFTALAISRTFQNLSIVESDTTKSVTNGSFNINVTTGN